MNGKELSELMENSKLKTAIAKHARRYSSQVEDQEEYIQEAWLRIARNEGGLSIEYYMEEGRKSIKAVYSKEWMREKRSRENVQQENYEMLNGNSKREEKKKSEYVDIGHGKYVKRKLESLLGWYYENEWEEWLYFRHGNYCIRKADAEHHGVPYDERNIVDKSFAQKYRVNNIEVEP